MNARHSDMGTSICTPALPEGGYKLRFLALFRLFTKHYCVL